MDDASTNSKPKIRILVVEDHEIVRDGVRMMVNSQPDMQVVAEAADGRTAVQLVAELAPDVVVMDISMRDMNGLQATEKIKQRYPAVKILTLTRHTDLGFLQQMLGAGASGYVLKQSASKELLHAIRTVAAGGKHLDPAIAGKVIGGFARDRSKAGTVSPRNLTHRESEVLRLIATGYSNKEIAARLDLSVKTVEVHKANAMRKLDMRSRIDIVRYAVLQGWLQGT